MEIQINRNEIIELLISKIKRKGLRLPSYVNFHIKNKVLYIGLSKRDSTKGIVYSCAKNMQSDEAAFEGWSICLKHHLSLFIDNVELNWEKPVQISRNEQLHYNRFVYRVIRFEQMFDWFSVAVSNKKELSDFEKELTNLVVNTPLSESSKTSDKSSKEAQIEYNQQNKEYLKGRFQLQCINHQLPVGVKKDNKSFFTGRASAIDIWGIDKQDILNIFELKHNNSKVGIISELFFYSVAMHDLLITNQINPPPKIMKFRNAEFLYGIDAIPIKGIKSYFLFDELHPMVVGTTNLLNTNNFGIKFFNVKYKLRGDSLLINFAHYKGGFQMEEELKQSYFRNSRRLNGCKYILRSGSENFYEFIYCKVKKYFKENNIAWWEYGGNSENEPTNHMVSSQVQCLNFLFALRNDKDAVLKIAQLFDSEINDVLPTIDDIDNGFIAFEFVYDNANILGENNTERGKYCTSIDVFIIGMRKDRKVLIPIEWKYTENYLDAKNKAQNNSKGKTRQSRYNHLIENSKQLKVLSNLPNSVYYFEPFYQLMRQTLLVEQMVLKGIADDFLHIIVIPFENEDFLSNNYSFTSDNFETTWRKSLYNQSKFKIIDSKRILKLIESLESYSEVAEYLTSRY